MEPVIRVENLTITLPEGADRAHAVEQIDAELRQGEILCVVGESGSGKSMWANAIMGLLPPLVRASAGRILFEGDDLLTLDESGIEAIRGARIAMIFQEPMTALNPLMRVSDQIAEVFEAHGNLSGSERRDRALALLEEVGIPDPARAARAYPFQLSGGQRQRVMIAMALALEPQVLIADEPTTALDVTTQAQILDLIRDLQRRHGMAVLFITHDFGVVAEIADRVLVMQHGRIVEEGEAARVLKAPEHAYTRALISAIPSLADSGKGEWSQGAPILSVKDLSKTFRSGGSAFGRGRTVRAVDHVSFEIGQGETLALVGESGSGKSTVGRCLVRLETPDEGSVLLAGRDMASLSSADLRLARKRIQMIFQDPYASLNPRARVRRTLLAGPMAHGMPRGEAMTKAEELLDLVGLDGSSLDRFPHEFSGGQRQRIGIARALMLSPDIIVADEAVSALDVSVQRQVLDLLADLKKRLDLSLLFITHDLRVAAEICDRVAVMQQGRIVEIGPVGQVFASPESAYTRSLLDAIPGRDGVTKPAHGSLIDAG